MRLRSACINTAGRACTCGTWRLKPCRRDFAPGQSMFADYYGFAPGARLEVGFYRTVPGGLKQTLVDLWQVTIGQNGRFVETLPIPANASAGEYALIACDLAACETYLDRVSSQLAANVFWEEFTVTYPARVSSTVSGSGLPLWSTLECRRGSLTHAVRRRRSEGSGRADQTAEPALVSRRASRVEPSGVGAGRASDLWWAVTRAVPTPTRLLTRSVGWTNRTRSRAPAG